ncbi:hypothetical protein F8M41_006647 [Gigaspora margarita]|uniref:Uncharacterized protein n=1 Tax=Gigaspora margarita TaxID=4874 RepID=A0A8H3X7M5_GIGMA|nr:hypothetical protein F8M41_006647 [Gigaspora margarita]
MCVERINKGVESIKRNGTVMTCKLNVDIEKLDKSKRKNAMIESVNKFDEIVENELNKDLEMAKLEVGDVSEDNANVAKTADQAGENGTISELLCSYWLCAGE